MCVHCRLEGKLSVCLKTNTPSCIPKKKLKLFICVGIPTTRPRTFQSTITEKSNATK